MAGNLRFVPGPGWFEVFPGNQGWTHDHRNDAPRIGRVPIARRRDAVDVAISDTF